MTKPRPRLLNNDDWRGEHNGSEHEVTTARMNPSIRLAIADLVRYYQRAASDAVPQSRSDVIRYAVLHLHRSVIGSLKPERKEACPPTQAPELT